MSKEIRKTDASMCTPATQGISIKDLTGEKIADLRKAIKPYIAGKELTNPEIQGLCNLPELLPLTVSTYLNGLKKGIKVDEDLAKRIISKIIQVVPELSKENKPQAITATLITQPALPTSGAALRVIVTAKQRPEDYAMIISTKFLPDNKIAILGEEVVPVAELINSGMVNFTSNEQASPVINPFDPDRQNVLRMLEQAINEVAKNKAEEKTNSLFLLNLYKTKFEENGYVSLSLAGPTELQNRIKTLCNTHLSQHSGARRGYDPSTLEALVWIDKVGLGFQQDTVRAMNDSFNNPLIQKLMTSLFLKEACYVDEFYSNPKTYRRIIAESALFKQHFDECLASRTGGLEIVERAKMLIGKQLDWEYRGFVVMLKYLQRQGINSESLKELNLESNPVLKLLAETIPQNMKFITPEGKIDEKNYKLYLSPLFTNNWRNSGEGPLKDAIDTIIRFYKHQNQISELKPQDYEKLFAFVNDEYYFKV